MFRTRPIGHSMLAVKRPAGGWALIHDHGNGQWQVADPDGGAFYGPFGKACAWAVKHGRRYPSLKAIKEECRW